MHALSALLALLHAFLPVHCLNEQTIRRAHRQVEFESGVYPQARAAQFRYRLYVRAPRHEQRWSKKPLG